MTGSVHPATSYERNTPWTRITTQLQGSSATEYGLWTDQHDSARLNVTVSKIPGQLQTDLRVEALTTNSSSAKDA